MRKPALVRLDFIAQRARAPVAGLALCALGLVAAVTVGVLFDGQVNERNRLDAAVNSAQQSRAANRPSSVHSTEEAAKIQSELSIPWSLLLTELEAAGKDSGSTVSLLQVEPNPGKHSLRITAEARSLPAALAYLKRLQQSKVLRYPMLESHELKKDDPEHPVRVKLAAEWQT